MAAASSGGDTAARALAGGIGYALTLNDPNIMNILKVVLPPQAIAGQHAMLAAAAQAYGTTKFAAGNAIEIDDIPLSTRNLIAGHKAARAALPLGGRAFSWAVGRDIPDNQSGYRLIDRRLMAALLASSKTGFTFEVEMITTCIRGGWPMAWVPIRTIYAGERSHIRPLAHLVSFVRVVREARRTVRLPLP